MHTASKRTRLGLAMYFYDDYRHGGYVLGYGSHSEDTLLSCVPDS